jgi:hypothetical protein
VTWWQIALIVFYLFVGLDNVLEAPSCGSGFWCCWPNKAAAFFLWPLQALRGVYNVAWVIRDARRGARRDNVQRGPW